MSEHSKGPKLRFEAAENNIYALGHQGEWLAVELRPNPERMDRQAAEAEMEVLGRKMAAAMELVEACQKVRARAQEAAEAMPGMTLERLLRTGDGVEIRLPVSIVAECIAALKTAGVKP